MLSPFLPSARSFVPRAWERRRFRARVRATVEGAQSTLHLTHAACLDGAACDAIVRLALGEVSTAFIEPHETLETLRLVAGAEGRGRALVVSDLSFQKGQGVAVLAAARLARDNGWRLSWRDHHAKQWDGAPLDALSETGDWTVDLAGKECGATLVQKALAPSDAFARELADVVRDHDLWILKDPRSVRLQSAAFHAGSAAFVARILETRDLADARLAEWADEAEREKKRLVEAALARAFVERGARAAVGVAYGRVPTNEVLHSLEQKGAHLSVLLKPDGGFSLRSAKAVPVCHLVAQRHGGGGHPNASGGRLALGAAERLAYWVSRGRSRTARRLVTEAVAEVDRFLAEPEALK